MADLCLSYSNFTEQRCAMQLCTFATDYVFALNMASITGQSDDECFTEVTEMNEFESMGDIQMARRLIDFVHNGGPLVTRPMRSIGDIRAHVEVDNADLERMVMTLVNGNILTIYDMNPTNESAQELTDEFDDLNESYFITLDI